MNQQSKSPKSSERVEPEEFSTRVASKLEGIAAKTQLRYGQVEVTVPAERAVKAAEICKSDPDLDCDYFTFLSAIDWQQEGFEVIVVLFSTGHKNTVILRAKLPAGTDASMPTFTTVYRGANWHERECAEMFGIRFDGHPNLVHLYLPPDFEGHPLLKSFQLASRQYKPWPGAKDPEEAGAGGR